MLTLSKVHVLVFLNIFDSKNCFIIWVSSEEKGKLEEISSAPGHFNISADRVNEYLKPKIEAGLKAVLLCNTHEDFRVSNYSGVG